MWAKYELQLHKLQFPPENKFTEEAMEGFDEFVGTKAQIITEEERRRELARVKFDQAYDEWKERRNGILGSFYREVKYVHGCKSPNLTTEQKIKINEIVESTLYDVEQDYFEDAFCKLMEVAERIVEVVADE